MNLIPFALSKNTNQLVDVADVESGKKCDCICPSCNIPLVAKKGEVNEWHFAHDSQYVDKAQEKECEFSWVVAIKMMLKQLLVDGSKLTLPSYKLPHKGIGYQKSPHILLITDASTIEYSNPELKALTCDVIVDVKNTKLGIIFFMKEIPAQNFTDLDKRLGGVIGINIKEVALKDNKAINNLRNHMKFMLEGKTFAKKWIYHKNEEAKIASHEQHLQKQTEVKIPAPWMSKNRKTAYTAPDIKKDALKINQQFYCIRCDHDYQGTEKGINKCPLCHEHLYRVEI